MNKNQIELLVCSESGGKLKEYSHEGMAFIEAKENHPFLIKIKNNSSRRALATLSIDGKCCISSKNAEESETGYIVPAFSSIEIKGFRVSDEESAKFVFGSGQKSYASYLEVSKGNIQKGESAKNNGVVGVKITWEKEKPEIIY